MKGGRDGKGPPSADLLICFPSRAHLTLMPKPICSPARPPEPRNCHNHRPNRSRHLRRPSGHASPLFWAKTKPTSSDISEPTSPKVTCAGQIKVRPKPSSCKNWQSVMEEIERLHINKKQKKRSAWMEALGFKKDVMQFLSCLRSLRFDFRCFGSFPSAEITSDDDDDDEDDDNEEDDDQFEDAQYTNRERLDIQSTGKMNGQCDESDESRTIFSKWFMVLQQNTDRSKEMITELQENKRKTIKSLFDEEMMEDYNEAPPCVPPSNALLLMRCRSAPAKSWLEEKEDDEKGETDEEKEEKSEERCEKTGNEESKESLVVMAYGADFSKFSSDIAKETWVVGGIRDLLSRSRSWKR